MSDEGHRMLETLREHLARFGWRCEAEVWRGYNASYRFVCSRGHRIERVARPVVYRAGSPECAVCEAEDIRTAWLSKVATRGGELIGGPFTGLQARYRLRCAVGHEWEAQGRKISEGNWCPSCAHEASARRHRKSDGLEQLQAAAVAKGGRCLATEYTIGRDRYRFECALGHRWEAEGHEVIRGSWCAVCAREQTAAAQLDPEGLVRLQAVARGRGGECLTQTYGGQAAKYLFRCASGHEWRAVGQNVLNGCWCRRCAADSRRLTIEHMHEIAAARGGACLSDVYVNKEAKLTWQCHRGHVWRARAGSVKNAGRWCPACAVLDRINAKNGWKRLRYEASGDLPGSTG